MSLAASPKHSTKEATEEVTLALEFANRLISLRKLALRLKLWMISIFTGSVLARRHWLTIRLTTQRATSLTIRPRASLITRLGVRLVYAPRSRGCVIRNILVGIMILIVLTAQPVILITTFLESQITIIARPIVSLNFDPLKGSFIISSLARRALMAIVIEVKRRTERCSCREFVFGDTITLGLGKTNVLIRSAAVERYTLGASTCASRDVRCDSRAVLRSTQTTELVIWETPRRFLHYNWMAAI
jgi:hypothetical protein